jgi:hypothetical protein
MNISGGAKRIQFAGRCLIGFSLILFGVCVCALLAALLFPSIGLHVALAELVLIPLFAAVPGASLWLIGWIIEGFAGNDAREDRVRT